MSTRLEVNPYQYTDTVSTSRISKSDPETPIVAFGPVVFEDFWHAYNFRLRRSRKIGACIVFVCVAALALLTREQFLSQGLPMLATLVVMTVGLFLSSKASVRKAYAASGKVRRWVFTKSGLQYELEEGETAFFTWKLIAHAEHSDRVLIVTTATNQLLLVPRAAFDDDSEWQQALDWLDEYRQTGANGEPQDAPFSLAKKKEDIGTDVLFLFRQ